MVNRGRLLEIIIYIALIIVAVLACTFMFFLSRDAFNRETEKGNINYYEGRITDYYDVRGIMFIEFDKQQNIVYKLDVWAVNDKEMLERYIAENKFFKAGYISDAIYKDAVKIVKLESDGIVFTSTDSSKTAMIKNKIIVVAGIVVFASILICLIIGFVRTLRL